MEWSSTGVPGTLSFVVKSSLLPRAFFVRKIGAGTHYQIDSEIWHGKFF